MCMDFAAPSVFPRKLPANSCEGVNILVEIITWPHCYVFLMLLLLLAEPQQPLVQRGLCLPWSSWRHQGKPGPGAMHCFGSGNWTSALQAPRVLPSQAPPPKLASFSCRWGLCHRIVPRVPSLIYPAGVSSQCCLYCSVERFAWKVCIFQETAMIKYTWKKALWWIIRT